MPGGELVLRLQDLAPRPDTTVIVNCPGRTRSIIGTQPLINAGVPNKVPQVNNALCLEKLNDFEFSATG